MGMSRSNHPTRLLSTGGRLGIARRPMTEGERPHTSAQLLEEMSQNLTGNNTTTNQLGDPARNKCPRLLTSGAMNNVLLRYVSPLVTLDTKVAVVRATRRCSARYVDAPWDPRNLEASRRCRRALVPTLIFAESAPVQVSDWISLANLNQGLTRSVRFTHLLIKASDLVIGAFACSSMPVGRLAARRALNPLEFSGQSRTLKRAWIRSKELFAVDRASLLRLFAAVNQPTRCSLALLSGEVERRGMIQVLDGCARAKNQARSKRRRVSGGAPSAADEDGLLPSASIQSWQAWAAFVRSAESPEALAKENEALRNLVVVSDNPELRTLMSEDEIHGKPETCACNCRTRFLSALGAALGSVKHLSLGVKFALSKKDYKRGVTRWLSANSMASKSKSAAASSLSRHALLPNLRRSLAETDGANTIAESILLSLSGTMVNVSRVGARFLNHEQTALLVAHFKRLPLLTAIHLTDIYCPDDWAATLVAELLCSKENCEHARLVNNLEELVVREAIGFPRVGAAKWDTPLAAHPRVSSACLGEQRVVVSGGLRRLELDRWAMFKDQRLTDVVAEAIRQSGAALERVTVPSFTESDSTTLSQALASAAIGAPLAAGGSPYRHVKLTNKRPPFPSPQKPVAAGTHAPRIEPCGPAGAGLRSFEVHCRLEFPPFEGRVEPEDREEDEWRGGSAAASVLRALNTTCSGLDKLCVANCTRRFSDIVCEALKCTCYASLIGSSRCAACSRSANLSVEIHCAPHSSDRESEPPPALSERLRSLRMDAIYSEEWIAYGAKLVAACQELRILRATAVSPSELSTHSIIESLALSEHISTVSIRMSTRDKMTSLATEEEFWEVSRPEDCPMNLAILLSKPSLRSFVCDNSDHNIVSQKWSSRTVAEALALAAPVSKLRRLDVASSARPDELLEILGALRGGFRDLRSLSIRASAHPVTVDDAERPVAPRVHETLSEIIASSPDLVSARVCLPIEVKDKGTAYEDAPEAKLAAPDAERALRKNRRHPALAPRLAEAIRSSNADVRVVATPMRRSSYEHRDDFIGHMARGIVDISKMCDTEHVSFLR